MLDIQELSLLADFFVIANATSERQLRALVEAVQEINNTAGAHPRVEGDVGSGWVLVDHGGVVTHLFSKEKREYYGLEQVWRQAHVVVRVQ